MIAQMTVPTIPAQAVQHLTTYIAALPPLPQVLQTIPIAMIRPAVVGGIMKMIVWTTWMILNKEVMIARPQ